MVSALEFFYRVTPQRREIEFCLPRPKVPANLPQVLAREEVAALIEKTTNLKQRALLMATDGAGSRLLQELRRHWLLHRPKQWLFPSPRVPELPLSKQTAHRIYHAVKGRAEITKAGCIHALRHTFAPHLLEAGADIHTIQRLMGPRTTERYFHLAQKHLSGIASPLDLLGRADTIPR